MNLVKDAGDPATADSPGGVVAALTGSALPPNPMLRTITAPPSESPVATSRLTIQPGNLFFRCVSTTGCCASGAAGTAVWSKGSEGGETTNGAIGGNSGCEAGYLNSAVSDGFGWTTAAGISS